MFCLFLLACFYTANPPPIPSVSLPAISTGAITTIATIQTQHLSKSGHVPPSTSTTATTATTTTAIALHRPLPSTAATYTPVYLSKPLADDTTASSASSRFHKHLSGMVFFTPSHLPDTAASSIPSHLHDPLPSRAASSIPRHLHDPLPSRAASSIPSHLHDPLPSTVASSIPSHLHDPLPSTATSFASSHLNDPLPNTVASSASSHLSKPLPNVTYSIEDFPDDALSSSQPHPESLPSSIWVKVGPHTLTTADREILAGKHWLGDGIINAAQYLLKTESNILGLQSTVLGQGYRFQSIPAGKPFVQILHVHRSHWITVTNIGCVNDSSIMVYDSAFSSLSLDTMLQICSLVRPSANKLTFKMANIYIVAAEQ